MKASELKDIVKVVRFLVREELKKELPRMVESVLSEKYIRKLVAESTSRHMPTMTEVVGDDLRSEEEIQNEPPEVLANTHKGIYQKSPLVKGKSDHSKLKRESLDVAARLLAADNPAMADIFESIDPRALAEMRSGGVDPKEIPAAALEKKFDFSRMAELAGQTPVAEASSAPSRQEALEARAERMLEMRRQALEVPVNGGGGQPRTAPRRVLAEAPAPSAGQLDIPPFEPVGVLS